MASTQVSRNDPCPCGSGQKYKRCCLGKAPALRGWRLLRILLVLIGVIAMAVVVSLLFDLKSGLGTGAGLLLIAGILFAVRGAPSGSAHRRGPSDINFGK